MESITNKKNIRLLVIVNYASLMVFVILFEYFRIAAVRDLLSISATAASFLVFVLSFYMAYGRTGAWKQIHMPFSRLDEREAGIAYDSLRLSYAIYTVVILTALLVYALGGFAVSIIVFAAFLLFAHILPASVMLWRIN